MDPHGNSIVPCLLTCQLAAVPNRGLTELIVCCFDVLQHVAESRSNDAFVALCLLTVGGSSLLTKQLGLSDTLGAFIAGVLLAETSFRTQVRGHCAVKVTR